MNINIYYQDTDSLHIEHDKVYLLDQEFEKLHGCKLICENIMGCFHNDFDKLKDAYATFHISLGKKKYYDKLTSDNGETAEHFRLKGVTQRSIIITAQRDFGGSFQKLYEYLYDGNVVVFDLINGAVSFKFSRDGYIIMSKNSNV